MEKFNVTLYDLLGYLVPGCLINSVIVLYFSDLFSSEVLLLKFYKLNLLWQLLFGYVSGNLLQAITSFSFRFNVEGWWKRNKWDPNLKHSIAESLSVVLSKTCEQSLMVNRETLRLAESVLQAQSAYTELNIYRALIGFFRGMTGAFILLSIVLFSFYLKNTSLPLNIILDGIILSSNLFGGLAVISLVFALITFLRFRQFTTYRLEVILLHIYASDIKRVKEPKKIDPGKESNLEYKV